MWVAITLTIIAFAVVLCGIFIALPMCKEYDELYSEDNVAYDAQDEPTEENSGTSALNK